MIDDDAPAGSAGVRDRVPSGLRLALLVHRRGDAGGVEDALAEVCGDLNHLKRSGYGFRPPTPEQAACQHRAGMTKIQISLGQF